MSVDSGPALVEKINTVLPVTPSACWSLYGVEKDLSVWQCHEKGLTGDGVGTVHACCTVVRSSVNRVLRTLVDHNQRVNWDCTVSTVKTVAMSTGPCMSQHAGRNDVVAITPRVWTRWSLLRRDDASISMARWWQCHKSNDWAWMLWQSLDGDDTDVMWTYALVSSYPVEDHCAVVIVVGSSASSIPQPATAQQMLTGLHQYLTILQISQHIVIPSSGFRLEKSGEDDDEDDVLTAEKAISFDSTAASGNATPRDRPPPSMSPAAGIVPVTTHGLWNDKAISSSDSESLTDQQQKFAGILNAALSSVEQGVEESADEGWETVVTRGGVDVMKKTAGLSISCTRCSIIIDAPARIILDCFEDNSKLAEWDEMMSESRTVEYVTESMWVEHWTHKPVWPATSRDFCVVAGHTRLDNGCWVSAARSVVHPACPGHPVHVRGHVLESGAVIRPIGDDGERCLVSYISHFDFKGNVSAVVAHRISQCIPTCMLALQHLSVLTQQQLVEDLKKQRQSAAELAASALVAPLKGSDRGRGAQRGTNGAEDVDSGVAGDQEEEVSGEGPLSNQALEYPMVDQCHVDYRTLGNQAAAGLLAELLHASDIDVYQPRNASGSGGWQFDGIEKDVVILRKEIRAIGHSLFMGKGIVPLPVDKVWSALREPHTRFGYDPMLKEMRTVAKYGDRLMIMYMMLEARQCLLAQARDFCFLHHERIEGKKHIIAAQSVDHPMCPRDTDVLRGQIVSSGWCVEAAEDQGKSHSMVTYLGRIDLKGNVPQRLTNFICRRQTLAIHALSKYLLSAS